MTTFGGGGNITLFGDVDGAFGGGEAAADADADVFGAEGRTFGSGSFGFPTIEDEDGPRWGIEVCFDADLFQPVSWVDFSYRLEDVDVARGARQSDRFVRVEPGRVLAVIDDSSHPLRSQVALVLDGVSGSRAYAPHDPLFEIGGDLDLRIKLTAVDWSSGTQYLVAHGGLAVGGYGLRVGNTGLLTVFWHDGSSPHTIDSTAAVPFADGTVGWLSATLDTVSGANHRVTFYTSTDGVTWTQLGAAVETVGNTEIGAADGVDLRVGAAPDGTGVLNGSVHRVEVRDGIGGTVVANPNFGLDYTGWWLLGGATVAQVGFWSPSTRWLDPDNPTSPFAGALDELRPVRVYMVAEGTTWPRFHGYTDPEAFTPSVSVFARHMCTLRATDLLRYTAGDPKLPQSGWEVAMSDLREPYDADEAPLGQLVWWHRFGREAEVGTIEEFGNARLVFRDSGPNGFHGQPPGSSPDYESLQPSLISGSSDPALRFVPGIVSSDDTRIIITSAAAALTNFPCALFVSFRNDAANIGGALYEQTGLLVRYVFSGNVLEAICSGPGWGPITLTYPGTFQQGVTYHVLVTFVPGLASMYVHDGSTMLSDTEVLAAGATALTGGSAPAIGPNESASGFPRDMTIDEVAAMYDVGSGAFGTQARAMLIARAIGRFDRSETVDIRARRLFDFAGIPQGLLEVDDGGGSFRTVTATEQGNSVLEALHSLADLERTRAFADQLGVVQLRTADVVPPAAADEFGDATSGEIHYERLQKEQSEAFSRVEVTDPNRVTPFVAEDSAARRRLGNGKVLPVTLPRATQADADDLLADVKVPRTRVTAMTLWARDLDALAEIVRRDLGDTVIVRHRPAGAGYTLEQPSVIAGIADRGGDGINEAAVTWRLIPQTT